MANGQPQNGTVANGSTANTNAGSAQTNQLQPLQAQQQVISKVFSPPMSSQTYNKYILPMVDNSCYSIRRCQCLLNPR